MVVDINTVTMATGESGSEHMSNDNKHYICRYGGYHGGYHGGHHKYFGGHSYGYGKRSADEPSEEADRRIADPDAEAEAGLGFGGLGGLGGSGGL